MNKTEIKNENKISKTAYYTCGARSVDCKSKTPIGNDYLAQHLMGDFGWSIFKDFENEKLANHTISARHKIIDDFIVLQSKTHDNLQVINIGSGLDTRPYRIGNGIDNWIEIDVEEMISYKKTILDNYEIQCNKLSRFVVSSDFGLCELTHIIKNNIDTHRKSIIIYEGVFPYLQHKDILDLLNELNVLFSDFQIVFDSLSKSFYNFKAKPLEKRLKLLGGEFHYLPIKNETILKEAKYLLHKKISVIDLVLSIKYLYVISFIVKKFFPKVLLGYEIIIASNPK